MFELWLLYLLFASSLVVLLMLGVTNANKCAYSTQLVPKSRNHLIFSFVVGPLLLPLATCIFWVCSAVISSTETSPQISAGPIGLILFLVIPASLVSAGIGYYIFYPAAKRGFRNYSHFALNAGGIGVLGGLVIVIFLTFSAVVISVASGGNTSQIAFIGLILGTIGVLMLGPPLGFLGGLLTALLGFNLEAAERPSDHTSNS